ncbi:MAG: DUF2914 domain-containing protein [Nitrospirae bacterium]|jgi:hypothetical protein|nr:DUF2914 domain-containing protein [Nitrospirota bacterium]
MKSKYGFILLAFPLFVLFFVPSSVLGEEQSEIQIMPAFNISRIVIAEGIEEREPIGVAETFPASTEKVYCFIEATDIAENTEATFVWYHEGKEMHTFNLPLMEGPRWRIFAYKNLYGEIGNWKVDIKDAAGNTIKSITFKVE